MRKPIIGVYKITNTLCPEGKYYIGYSCNVKQRWQTHKSTLRGGYHCNIRMQRAYEKYGSECFDYEILQECENEEEAKNIELSYLEDLTIRDKLYNLHYNSSGGYLMTYHPNKEQIIERMKNTQKEQISKMTKEERQERWGQSGEKMVCMEEHIPTKLKDYIQKCIKVILIVLEKRHLRKQKKKCRLLRVNG